MAQVQTLQGLLHRLMAGEASPFMVAGGGADSGQLQIGLRLLQLVGGTIHLTIVAAAGPGTCPAILLISLMLGHPPLKVHHRQPRRLAEAP
jgi:hypothetical protein